MSQVERRTTIAPAVHDSRIAVPPLPPRYTSRPRLLDRLDDAVSRPLTLLASGPGSGKTALLSEWTGTRPETLVWVSLGSQQNEPHRFWRLLAEAFTAAAWSGADDDEEELTGRWREVDGPEDLDVFFGRAEAQRQRVLMVLDDAHELTHPEVLSGIDALLRQRRSQLVVVMAARSDPVLPLHRYRLAGVLSEIRVGDLRMTEQETARVLAAHGVALRGRALNLLATRTEGWVAGVRLSAMSMVGHPHPAELVSQLAMDSGSVGEYLTQEVLSQQPADAHALLLRTGFLGEVTPDLAAHVANIPDAGRILDDLSAGNSFVVPLDPEHTTFRYHQLLAEILRHLLHRESEEERRAVVQRAVDWYVDHDRLDDALRTALDFGDWRISASLLVGGGFVVAFIARTDLSAVRDAVPLHTELDSTGALAVAALHASTDAARAREYLERIDTDEVARGGGRERLTVGLVELLLARTERRHGDVEQLARDLLRRTPEEGLTDALAAAIKLEQSQSRFWNAQHTEVEEILGEARALAGSAGVPHLELEAVAQLALACGFWGRIVASRSYERSATRLVRQFALLNTPPTLHLAAAQRYLFEGDFGAAEMAVRRAERAQAETNGDLQLAIRGMRATLLVLTRRFAEAAPLLHRLAQQGDRLITDYATANLADIETSLGRPSTAVRLLTASGRTTQSNITALSLAKAYFMLGDLDRAEKTLRPVLAMSINPPSIRIVLIEALILEAAIAIVRGPEERSVECLMRAISMANGEVPVMFMLTGEHFADLISRHPSLADAWPVPLESPSDLLTERVTAGQHRADSLPEPLTERESAVLQWLATSMSTSEIADKLYLSVNTVKTHVAAIYRKLPATGRRDAIRRARELELL